MVKAMRAIACFCMLLLASGPGWPKFSLAQHDNNQSAFSRLSKPEKCWVMKHPFIARKAYIISQNVLDVTDSIKSAGKLDRDVHGGRVDAFKHAFWMAATVQKIHWRKARRLGLAHEKGNYIQFRKAAKKGNKSSHDLAAIAMDIWNNQKGIEIGLEYYGQPISEIVDVIIQAIKDGEMRMIRKNEAGQYLSANGQIIDPADIKAEWDNPRMIIPSNIR